jgi:hypothetical protein
MAHPIVPKKIHPVGWSAVKYGRLRYPKSRRHRLQLAPPEEMDGSKWSGGPSRLVISSVNGARLHKEGKDDSCGLARFEAPAASCISLAQVA